MEVSVTQKNLAKALGNIGRVASGKTNLQILSNILFRTDNNQLVIAATNLEIAATERIGAKVIKNGSFTVPAKLMTEFVSNLSNDTVELKVAGNSIHIKSSKNSSSINGMSDDEFPELPIIDEKKSLHVSLPVALFKESINQTIITASNDATRPVLTGVYWHTFEGSLYLAATDGYRLSEKKVIDTTDELDAIIPTSTLQEVLRTLDDSSEEIEILFDDTQVRFRIAENEITSRLIDGKFPDYRQLIPSSTLTGFEVDIDELRRIVKLAGLFARESGGSISISVDTKQQLVNVHSVASELGENSSDISTKTTGEDASVTLNSRYLNDALNVLQSKQVSFNFSGKLSPCLLHGTDKNSDYKHIVMPIKS